MTGMPPLLEVVLVGVLAEAQSSLPAVACRIIISSPMFVPLSGPQSPGKPLISLCAFRVLMARFVEGTASPLHPLAGTSILSGKLAGAAVSVMTFHLNPACPAYGRMNAANSNLTGCQHGIQNKKLAEISGIAAGTAPNPAPWRKPADGSGGSFHPSFFPVGKATLEARNWTRNT